MKPWSDMAQAIRKAIRAWWMTILLVILPLWLFLHLAKDVRLNEGFTWDLSLMLALHGLSQPWLDTVFVMITQTGGGLVGLFLLVTAVYLWRRQQQQTAVLFMAACSGAMALNSLLKLLFARPRPDVFPPFYVVTNYSFPSGHTMLAVMFYGLLAIWLWHNKKFGWAIFSGFWILLVALSRVYLGVHYPSDVLASLAVGILFLVIIVTIYKWRQDS
jgi:undecaprenyl-diphosphatase